MIEILIDNAYEAFLQVKERWFPDTVETDIFIVQMGITKERYDFLDNYIRTDNKYRFLEDQAEFLLTLNADPTLTKSEALMFYALEVAG